MAVGNGGGGGWLTVGCMTLAVDSTSARSGHICVTSLSLNQLKGPASVRVGGVA